MACINMFNPDHLSQSSSLNSTPRISFSNDFMLEPPPPRVHDQLLSDPDFEFGSSAGTRPMMAADELFFKGKMVPLRGEGQNCHFKGSKAMTLREELSVHDDDLVRPQQKHGMRWKGFLGLKKVGGLKKINEREVSDVSYDKEQCGGGGGGGGGGRAKDAVDMSL